MYGITIAAAILICTLLAEKIAKKQGKDVEILWGIVFIGVVFGVIGARAYHVIDFWDFYAQNLVQIFKVWLGGLGIYGGIFGGGAAVALYLRQKLKKNTIKDIKTQTLQWLDIAAQVLVLGQAIGRLGNYFNNELLPYAIYEGLADLTLFGILLILKTTTSTKIRAFMQTPGQMTMIYLAGYALIRLFLEPMRNNSWKIGGINVAQGVSIAVLVGIIGIVFMRKKKAPSRK